MDEIIKAENSIQVVEENQCPLYIFDTERITRSTCTICKSIHRDEIEGWYQDQRVKNIQAIHKKAMTDKQIDVSYPAFRNHILYHYNTQKRNIGLVEFGKDIKKWVEKQTDKKLSIKSRIAILDREMVTLAEMNTEDVTMDERRKTAETIKKLAETIMNYESKLVEMSEKMKPVTIIFKQLQIIIDDELGHNQNNNVKKVLSSVLERLKDSIGDTIIEE